MSGKATGIKVVPEVTPLLGGNEDKWRLLIIADRYQANEAAVFDAQARRLAMHISTQAPFNRAGIKGRFQIYACFTPTGPEGMFEFDDRESERRYYGKPALVREYLNRHKAKKPVLKRRRNDIALVLTNFPKRGGAGEQGDDNIAWSTPVHLYFENGVMREDWCDVTLHELGHAFDLEDEYEDAWAEGDKLPLRGTNVWPDDRLDEASWLAICDTSPPDRVSHPISPFGADDLALFGRIGAGLFQGARYSSTAFWRSALRCKMRSTPDPFCKVCQRQIAAKIEGNG